MKTLIVVDSIGESAAGIVFEILIEELFRQNQELLILCRENKSERIPQKIIRPFNAERIKKKNLSKLSLILLKKDISVPSWKNKIFGRYKGEIKSFNPEVVLVLAAASSYPAIELGTLIKKRNPKARLHFHCVDAMPSPEGWGENTWLRNARIKYLRRFFTKANSISFTNEKMLQYQKKVFSLGPNTRWFIVNNPFNGKRILGKKEKSKILYLGSLGQKRSGKSLLKAFLELKQIHPEVELQFVGTQKEEILSYGLLKNPEEQGVEFIPWTNEPDFFVKEAKVLVDIDADIENDVFLSSKLIKYLNTNIPILSITKKDSPAYHLLNKNHSGIACSSFETEEIKGNLEDLLCINDFEAIGQQREEGFQKFKVEKIVSSLIKSL